MLDWSGGSGPPQARQGLPRGRGKTRTCSAQGLRRRDRVPRRDARVRDDAGETRAPPRRARGLLHRDDQQPLPAGSPKPRRRGRRKRRLGRRRSEGAATTPLTRGGLLTEGGRRMGKFDRRKSQKMKRRKAQVKKKEKLARRRNASGKKAAPAKRTSAKKEKAAPAKA